MKMPDGIKTRPVDVYYNIHRAKLSIRSRSKPRRVIAHQNSIFMRNCRFVVSEAGRQRVLRERRKNVHAVVRGEWVEEFSWGGFGSRKIFPADLSLDKWRFVTYNPYRNAEFVDVESGRGISEAEYVIINGKDIFAYNTTNGV